MRGRVGIWVLLALLGFGSDFVGAPQEATALPPHPPVDLLFPLTVTVDGDETVTGPNGFHCPPTCSRSYARGTSISLTAVPGLGATFAGWSEACGGAGACTVSMAGPKVVKATFSPAPGPISVQWFSFDPVAISLPATTPVELHVKMLGNPSSVQLDLAAGGTVTLTAGLGGAWGASLMPSQLLFGYQPDDVNRNFVGHLRIFQQYTEVLRLNTFINVLDASIPPATVASRGPQIHYSNHVVNIWRPDLPLLPPDALGFSEQVRSVANQFYEAFGDDYDFLNVVYSLPSFPKNRFHFQVKNEVRGIGLPVFTQAAVYGSRGRLQGISVFPIDTMFDMAETSALHELGHQWINYVAAPGPHWPLSSLARGIMGWNLPTNAQGLQFPFDLIPLGDYRLQSAEPLRQFTDLDLYLMGLLPADRVGTHVVFPNQNQALCGGCVLHGGLPLTVQDVMAAHGPRVPDASTSQKQFRVATIVVTRQRPLTDAEMSLFEHFAARGEATGTLPFAIGFEKGTTKPFFLATRGFGTLTTTLSPRLDWTPCLWCRK